MIKYFIFLSLFFVSCANKVPKAENSVSKKPNILLIVIDDLGYADFEPFSNHDKMISTPNMKSIWSSQDILRSRLLPIIMEMCVIYLKGNVPSSADTRK